jgi:hypothetical protein
MRKPNEQQKAFASGTVGIQKQATPTCRFEQIANRLGLTPDQYATSAELRAWVEQNLNTFYVPTALLSEWHLSTIYDEGTKPTKLIPEVDAIPEEEIAA